MGTEGRGVYEYKVARAKLASANKHWILLITYFTVGYESLHDLNRIIQSDISIGNLMMNGEEDNPSWPSFLIDLDLAIKENREELSGALNKTGTRAFMAIGALYGEKHSFMHDLESFFWVLYSGPSESRVEC
jgi:hypothetical protein